MILDDGCAWNGGVYRSLSQVAKAITGMNWNGHRFFGLKAVRTGTSNRKRSATPLQQKEERHATTEPIARYWHVVIVERKHRPCRGACTRGRAPRSHICRARAAGPGRSWRLPECRASHRSGGAVPLGYRVEDRALHVVEDEAEFVRALFRRYLEAGSVVRLKTILDAENLRSPVRMSRTGRRTGGVPISRGHLYWILSNPIYVGRLRHKGQVHDGLHAALIDPETWDQSSNSSKAKRRQGGYPGRMIIPCLSG